MMVLTFLLSGDLFLRVVSGGRSQESLHQSSQTRLKLCLAREHVETATGGRELKSTF